MLEISRKFGRTNPDTSLLLCDEAEKIATKLNFGKGIAGAWFERSIIYMKTSNLDTAILFNQKSIKINDSLQIKGQLAHNYNLMGIILLSKNELDQALDYFMKAKNLFHNLQDSSGIMFISNSLGGLHEALGNYDSAAYYFFNYINLCEKIGQEGQLAVGLVNLTNIYLQTEDYLLAKEYALRSIPLSQENNRPDLEVKANKYLAVINTKELNFKEALEYFSQAIELAEKINDQYELSSIYINMGNLYDDQKQYDNALECYNKSASIAKITGDIDNLSSSLLHKGLIHERKNNPDIALIYYDSVVNLLTGGGYYNELTSVYYNIYKIYEIKKDYKNAFLYQTEYYNLKDSALNINSKKVIADLTLKYEKEKDQAKILNLENTNLQKDLTIRRKTNQKNIFLFTGIGLVFLTVFGLIFFSYRAKKEKIIAEQRIKQLEEEKRLLAASSLVHGQEEERKRIAKDLHDGIGVILSTVRMQFSALKDKSAENKPLIDKATKLLEQAAGDVRRISHNMMPGLLTKFGFFEAVEDLFEQINDSGKIKAEIYIEGEKIRLQENLEIMLYRIIQEMVNNTLKYAEAKNISLIIGVQSDKLNIQFSDDGKGFEVEAKLKQKTAGLTNIMSRVSFLKGEISIESLPGKGTILFLYIPLINNSMTN
jgi:signal transduction histidine kinase